MKHNVLNDSDPKVYDVIVIYKSLSNLVFYIRGTLEIVIKNPHRFGEMEKK